jgi:single-strand DNA-binding protein
VIVDCSGRHRATAGGTAHRAAGPSQEDGMINDAQVFLSGYVARDPRFRITASGISTVSMRVAYTPRRVDRETGEWTDGPTSFVSVVCWRTLADNVAKCLHKGEPVLVKGRLQVRPYEKDGVSRIAVEIEATSVGHDLARGVASFQRPRRPVVAGQPVPDGHGGEPGPLGGPVAEAGPDGSGEAVAGLEGRNGTTPGLAPLDSPAEPAGVSAPF